MTFHFTITYNRYRVKFHKILLILKVIYNPLWNGKFSLLETVKSQILTANVILPRIFPCNTKPDFPLARTLFAGFILEPLTTPITPASPVFLGITGQKWCMKITFCIHTYERMPADLVFSDKLNYRRIYLNLDWQKYVSNTSPTLSHCPIFIWVFWLQKGNYFNYGINQLTFKIAVILLQLTSVFQEVNLISFPQPPIRKGYFTLWECIFSPRMLH